MRRRLGLGPTSHAPGSRSTMSSSVGQRRGVLGTRPGTADLEHLRPGAVELQPAVRRPGTSVRVGSWSRACRDGWDRSWLSVALSVSSNSLSASAIRRSSRYAASEVHHRDQRAGMFGSQLGLLERDRLLQDRQGVSEPAGCPVGVAEVMHREERRRVVGAQLELSDLQNLLQERDRLGKPSGVPIGEREVVHDGERLWVVEAELGPKVREQFLARNAIDSRVRPDAQ